MRIKIQNLLPSGTIEKHVPSLGESKHESDDATATMTRSKLAMLSGWEGRITLSPLPLSASLVIRGYLRAPV